MFSSICGPWSLCFRAVPAKEATAAVSQQEKKNHTKSGLPAQVEIKARCTNTNDCSLKDTQQQRDVNAIKAVRISEEILEATGHEADLGRVLQRAQQFLNQAVSSLKCTDSLASSTSESSTVESFGNQLSSCLFSDGVPGISQAACALSQLRSSNTPHFSIHTAEMLLQSASGVLKQLETRLLTEAVASWTPEYCNAAVELHCLYADLTQQALNPRPNAKQLRSAVREWLLQRSEPLLLLARILEYTSPHQHSSLKKSTSVNSRSLRHSISAWNVMGWELLRRFFAFASVVLLPQQGDHLSDAAPSASPSPVQSTSVSSTSTDKRKSVAAVSAMLHSRPPAAAWDQGLSHLTSVDAHSQHGLLYRALQTPMSATSEVSTSAAQLAAMQALKQLYGLQSANLIHQDVSRNFAALHFATFQHYYQAAGTEPSSPAAQLCRQHLQLLHSCISTGSQEVRTALQQAACVGFLLNEFSLEAKLYSEEQARAAQQAEEAALARQPYEDDDDDRSTLPDSVPASPAIPGTNNTCNGERSPGGTAEDTRSALPRLSEEGEEDMGRGSKASTRPTKFSFTYDLNEDLERLMAMEEETGEAVEVDGFDYDDEARELMARTPQPSISMMMPTPPCISNTTTPRNPRLPPLRLNHPQSPSITSLKSSLRSPNPLCNSARSFLEGPLLTDRETSSSKPAVPRLALGSLRSAASSRIVTPIRSYSRHDPAGPNLTARSAVEAVRRDSMGGVHHLRTPSSLGPLSGNAHVSTAGNASVITSRSDRTSETSSEVRNMRMQPSVISAASDTTQSSSSRLHHSHLSPLSSRTNSQLSNVRTQVVSIPASAQKGGRDPSPRPSVFAEPNTMPDKASQESTALSETPLYLAQPEAQHQRDDDDDAPGAHAGQTWPTDKLSDDLDVSLGLNDHMHRDQQEEPRQVDDMGVRDEAVHTHEQAYRQGGDEGTLTENVAAQGIQGAVPTQGSTDIHINESEIWDTVPDLAPRPPPLQPTSPAIPPPVPGGRAPSRNARLVPALNLGDINTRSNNNSGGAADSQGGATTSARSSLPTWSTMADSAVTATQVQTNTVTSDIEPPSSEMLRTSRQRDSAQHSCTQPGSYQRSVEAKLWYHDTRMHADLLHVLLQLLVLPNGSLDATHVQPFPNEAGIANVEHLMSWHLSGPSCMSMLPDLLASLLPDVDSDNSAGSVSKLGTEVGNQRRYPRAVLQTACLRLLRLLSRQLLDCNKYQDLVFHSRGAYGAIYRAKLVDDTTGQAEQVMIKSIELPGTGYDRSVLPDVYGEITILEKYALQPSLPALTVSEESADESPPAAPGLLTPTKNGTTTACAVSNGSANARLLDDETKGLYQGICQLRDYGLTQSAYWIVMRRYRCSLAEWRTRQPPAHGQSPAAIAMYLSILQQIATSMQILAADSVVHFDLKASNVLVEPLTGVKDGQLYGPPSKYPCEPPFRAVLADFGEARAYRSADEAFTARNRGTEVYKSPEMLLMHSTPGAATPGHAFRALPSAQHGASGAALPPVCASGHPGGAGLASDVWSFGLLTYELLAGRLLFNEADYASVTHRVAFGGGRYLALTEAESRAMGQHCNGQLQQLVESILIRDPNMRPSLKQVLTSLGQARADVLQLVQA